MPLVRLLAALTVLSASSNALAEEFHPEYGSDRGAICIEREEDMGFANIYPVSVDVDGLQRVSMIGGDAICLYEFAGAHALRLRWHKYDSRRPDHGALNSEVDRSAEFKVSVQSKQQTLLLITNNWAGKSPGANPNWALSLRRP